jgi:predicted phosphodiesterase
MKTIVISDLHLTNKFSQRTFNFLTKLFNSVDRVIINGDFWDSYITSFDKFVKSDWQQLFPLLKSKKTHYNYGNHDREKDCDQRVNLFSDTQGLSLTLEVGDKKLLIKHGNDLRPTLVESRPFLDTRLINNIFYKYGAFPFYGFLQRLSKGKFYKNYPRAKATINFFKNWARENMKDDEILVCSHSHIGKIDWNNNFLSTGSLQNHWAEFLLINDDEISLVKKRY